MHNINLVTFKSDYQECFYLSAWPNLEQIKGDIHQIMKSVVTNTSFHFATGKTIKDSS